eukprot:361401-Chlamydomonas_euryale.AAC.8
MSPHTCRPHGASRRRPQASVDLHVQHPEGGDLGTHSTAVATTSRHSLVAAGQSHASTSQAQPTPRVVCACLAPLPASSGGTSARCRRGVAGALAASLRKASTHTPQRRSPGHAESKPVAYLARERSAERRSGLTCGRGKKRGVRPSEAPAGEAEASRYMLSTYGQPCVLNRHWKHDLQEIISIAGVTG